MEREGTEEEMLNIQSGLVRGVITFMFAVLWQKSRNLFY